MFNTSKVQYIARMQNGKLLPSAFHVYGYSDDELIRKAKKELCLMEQELGIDVWIASINELDVELTDNEWRN